MRIAKDATTLTAHRIGFSEFDNPQPPTAIEPCIQLLADKQCETQTCSCTEDQETNCWHAHVGDRACHMEALLFNLLGRVFLHGKLCCINTTWKSSPYYLVYRKVFHTTEDSKVRTEDSSLK